MTPSASSASISVAAEAELAEELTVVLSEERRVPSVQPLGTTREPASGACCSGRFRSRDAPRPRRSGGTGTAAAPAGRGAGSTLPTGTPAAHSSSTTSSACLARHHSSRPASISVVGTHSPRRGLRARGQRPTRARPARRGAASIARRWRPRWRPRSRPGRSRRARRPGRGSAAPPRAPVALACRGARRRRSARSPARRRR